MQEGTAAACGWCFPEINPTAAQAGGSSPPLLRAVPRAPPSARRHARTGTNGSEPHRLTTSSRGTPPPHHSPSKSPPRWSRRYRCPHRRPAPPWHHHCRRRRSPLHSPAPATAPPPSAPRGSPQRRRWRPSCGGVSAAAPFSPSGGTGQPGRGLGSGRVGGESRSSASAAPRARARSEWLVVEVKGSSPFRGHWDESPSARLALACLGRGRHPHTFGRGSCCLISVGLLVRALTSASFSRATKHSKMPTGNLQLLAFANLCASMATFKQLTSSAVLSATNVQVFKTRNVFEITKLLVANIIRVFAVALLYVSRRSFVNHSNIFCRQTRSASALPSISAAAGTVLLPWPLLA